MSPKEFYQGYLADDNPSLLSYKLHELIRAENPNHVFEFGMGSGKNLRLFRDSFICVAGLDISVINVIHAMVKNDIRMSILGDESYLRNLANFDCVFTCSVLDHIEDIDGIIAEFKRIANKSVYLAETNDVPGEHYFPHEYETFGFRRVKKFGWVSALPDGDGATYYIWEWRKEWDVPAVPFVDDDLAITMK